MAEFMLRKAFENEQLREQVEVDSAATSRWEIGSPIDPRAASVLSQHGLGSESHRARQFDRSWFDDRDLILALDDGHLGELREWAPNADSTAKIHLVREFDPEAVDGDLSIADPWYGSSEDFERTWDLISAAIPGIVGYVQKQLSHTTG
ncbi:protein-tyrosine phosphatase [Antricoccus suffuscus]|uniref:protein-tyrosine-phosphatase n=2 Tax=Antricoccus suffuscus TaxID=1629062 RepID=A0A2T1A0C3_9ACTN|nr:protein-tyrosine phosphatase [Antricoccus suffuscus]